MALERYEEGSEWMVEVSVSNMSADNRSASGAGGGMARQDRSDRVLTTRFQRRRTEGCGRLEIGGRGLDGPRAGFSPNSKEALVDMASNTEDWEDRETTETQLASDG